MWKAAFRSPGFWPSLVWWLMGQVADGVPYDRDRDGGELGAAAGHRLGDAAGGWPRNGIVAGVVAFRRLHTLLPRVLLSINNALYLFLEPRLSFCRSLPLAGRMRRAGTLRQAQGVVAGRLLCGAGVAGGCFGGVVVAGIFVLAMKSLSQFLRP